MSFSPTSQRWRVSRITMNSNEEPFTIRKLSGSQRVITLFSLRMFEIHAEWIGKEESPSLSVVRSRMFVVDMSGNSHTFHLPNLLVRPSSGTRYVDFIEVDDYDWELAEVLPIYVEEEDRWITQIKITGMWNAFLPLGTFVVDGV